MKIINFEAQYSDTGEWYAVPDAIVDQLRRCDVKVRPLIDPQVHVGDAALKQLVSGAKLGRAELEFANKSHGSDIDRLTAISEISAGLAAVGVM